MCQSYPPDHPKQKLLLYSAIACHLCEDAVDLLQASSVRDAFYLETVDIIESPELQQRFRTSIPVLQHYESGVELYWPFSLMEFEHWLMRVSRR